MKPSSFDAMTPINLRSDTQTLPTEAMLAAIASATLGDDTYDEDPTVTQFEALAAERLGKEAALLVPSGHMGNLIALMVHAQPGDEVFLDAESHIYYYEVGSLANVAGLMPWPLASTAGCLDPQQLHDAIRHRDLHYPRARLVCLENTHNRSGGRVVPLPLHRELCAVAKERGLAVHLDGARIFNAAIAHNVAVTDYTSTVDSVMLCLTKGLSCPLGSVLAGTAEFIERANEVRRRLGGGLRQAGIIAAPGIVALKTMVARLADDHRHARRLAEGITAVRGLDVDLDSVQTNMVNVDHRASGLSTEVVLDLLGRAGVVASGRPPHHFRLVTNRHHDEATIDAAIARIATAMVSVG